MSKLADAIEMQQLRRVALYEPLSISVKDELNSVSNHYGEAWEYKLGVWYSVIGTACTDTQKHLLKESAKRQIIHTVFDEFRPALRKIDRAVMERKWEVALHALQELELEMFS